jgi:hypothetical protein
MRQRSRLWPHAVSASTGADRDRAGAATQAAAARVIRSGRSRFRHAALGARASPAWRLTHKDHIWSRIAARRRSRTTKKGHRLRRGRANAASVPAGARVRRRRQPLNNWGGRTGYVWPQPARTRRCQRHVWPRPAACRQRRRRRRRGTTSSARRRGSWRGTRRCGGGVRPRQWRGVPLRRVIRTRWRGARGTGAPPAVGAAYPGAPQGARRSFTPLAVADAHVKGQDRQAAPDDRHARQDGESDATPTDRRRSRSTMANGSTSPTAATSA